MRFSTGSTPITGLSATGARIVQPASRRALPPNPEKPASGTRARIARMRFAACRSPEVSPAETKKLRLIGSRRDRAVLEPVQRQTVRALGKEEGRLGREDEALA